MEKASAGMGARSLVMNKLLALVIAVLSKRFPEDKFPAKVDQVDASCNSAKQN